MKLDVNALRYLTTDDFRVLTAVELGMRNHQIVPVVLVERIAKLKHGGTYKVLRNLLKHKLVHHDSSKYDGFRLTYLGYDFLAIKTLVNRGVFVSVGRQIGVGKESDIFEVATEDGTIMAMKLHRLGRVSFRAVKTKRDYLRHRSSYNWLYLSRLAALKEYAFMKALGEHGFPVPNAIECNRHCIIMSLVQGYPLVQVRQLGNPDVVFETIIGLVVRLAEHGLIHCDFNEFNIMIEDDEKVTMIDFPQMVSISHRNAQMYFDRDVDCIYKYFGKRLNLSFNDGAKDSDVHDSDNEGSNKPSFSSIIKSEGLLDKELAASGFSHREQDVMDKLMEENTEEMNVDEEDRNNTTLSRDLDSLPLEDLKNAVDSITIEEEENHIDKKSADGTHLSSEGEESNSDSDDLVLSKRLNKQRQKAIAVAQRGHRSSSSRNSYKDKGRKSSSNSKIQKQSLNW